jgi:hypothetical protein
VLDEISTGADYEAQDFYSGDRFWVPLQLFSNSLRAHLDSRSHQSCLLAKSSEMTSNFTPSLQSL